MRYLTWLVVRDEVVAKSVFTSIACEPVGACAYEASDVTTVCVAAYGAVLTWLRVAVVNQLAIVACQTVPAHSFTHCRFVVGRFCSSL